MRAKKGVCGEIFDIRAKNFFLSCVGFKYSHLLSFSEKHYFVISAYIFEARFD